MRIFLTGASGFVGRHLARELCRAGHTVTGFDLLQAQVEGITDMIAGNLQDTDAISDAIARMQPDAGIHLGGMAFVPSGWKDTAGLFAINTLGAIHVLDAFRQYAPQARLLVVTSAEVYGSKPRPHPAREDDPLDPDNPYAISKAAADLITLQYSQRHGLPAMTARPYNHIGPGQSEKFVVASFAAQLRAIAAGHAPAVLKTGNLDGYCDFSDVRDIVRGYRMLIERGRAGSAYNLCSHRETTIRAILDMLCAISGVHPQIERDPERYRPAVNRPQLDTTRIENDLQWKTEIQIEQTLRDILAAANLNRE